jgi:uncharacterized protein (DUF342 family)
VFSYLVAAVGFPVVDGKDSYFQIEQEDREKSFVW